MLVRVVQLPEIEGRELAEFMRTYIETYESSLPTCLVFHPPDFAILKIIVNDRLFFDQEWITRLNDFLNRQPVPGVRPLICIAASEFNKLVLKEEELEKLLKILLQSFFHAGVVIQSQSFPEPVDMRLVNR
jgi:hypothetical protein